VKTTLEIPDPLLREAKAAAAAQGESLRKLVASALRRHLAAPEGDEPGSEGWRNVFGGARPDDVAQVDAAVEAELERVDPADWR